MNALARPFIIHLAFVVSLQTDIELLQEAFYNFDTEGSMYIHLDEVSEWQALGVMGMG